jgi:hypothetical protein
MGFNPDNLLHTLSRHVVSRAKTLSPCVQIEFAGTPRGLWAHRAIEDEAADVYSVLRIYGGGRMVRDALPRPSVQCMTIGKDAASAMIRGQLLFEMLCLDDLGQPMRMTTIDAFTADGQSDGQIVLVAVDPLQRPGLMSIDENGRASVVFNFDVGFRRPS